MDKTLEKYLKTRNISYVAHQHPAVFTVEESKTLKKSIPGLHCKALFLKDEKGNFYLVGMPAEKRLDVKNLRIHLKARKLHFASPEELKQEINLAPGSVSIFGAIYIKDKKVKLIIDKEVFDAETVGFHPNINTSTLEVKHEGLEKYFNSLGCEKEVIEL
jgi:Ala-tRNA(Pro) deacylase